MSISQSFQEFITNLSITNAETISLRYGEITSCLNKKFRNTDSKTTNCLRVGSIGRNTAINGVSDLDMLYIIPTAKWDDYKSSQYKLLKDTCDTISDRYPTTKIWVDRLVVCVEYTDFYIEVQPVFELNDGSFKYPDTYNGGSWKITKPREEISAMQEVNNLKNNNLRHLCKMTRAWKNKHGVGMGGLLIDTLAHNFLESTSHYDDKSFLYFDYLSRDFFNFLTNQPTQEYYTALGSKQRVKVRKKFQSKSKKAHQLCLDAIINQDSDNFRDYWKKIYGRPFPSSTNTAIAKSLFTTYRNTEQFIEDNHQIDIRYDLVIDCDISQKGFREHSLSEMIRRKILLRPQKELRFSIVANTTPEPYTIKWKVLNRGKEAERRDCIRGQIINGSTMLRENTLFNGDHVVECYIEKNGIIVAKDRIHVPIQEQA
jgi:hypothetical protein